MPRFRGTGNWWRTCYDGDVAPQRKPVSHKTLAFRDGHYYGPDLAGHGLFHAPTTGFQYFKSGGFVCSADVALRGRWEVTLTIAVICESSGTQLFAEHAPEVFWSNPAIQCNYVAELARIFNYVLSDFLGSSAKWLERLGS